jgi:hypothetical protein
LNIENLGSRIEEEEEEIEIPKSKNSSTYLGPCFTGLFIPPPPKTLHRERAVTGRIFQALPTQTDTVALIYKMAKSLNFIYIVVS